MTDDTNAATPADNAPSTNRQYEKVWRRFSAYADEMGCSPWGAHPLLIMLWFDCRRHLRTGTHEQAIAAIKKKHELAGVPLPDMAPVRLWIADHARHDGGRGPQRKNTSRHVTPGEVATLAKHCWQIAIRADEDLAGWYHHETLRDSSELLECKESLRDRAWMLLLYALGWRHHHTTHVDRDRTIRTSDAVQVTAAFSKNDQEGRGTTRKVDHLGNISPRSVRCDKRIVCPACALIDLVEYDKGTIWEAEEPAGSGPLFPSPNDPTRPWSGSSACARLRQVAAAAGLDEADRLGTHSFKKGHVTHRNVVEKESLEGIAEDVETHPAVLFRHYLTVEHPVPGKGHLGG